MTIGSLALSPRIGLRADVTSGDRDPNEPSLETFDALFPRGSYFGEAALIGPADHMDLHPSLDLRFAPWLTVSASWIFFWRQSRGDGVYASSGAVERSGRATSRRYIGSQARLLLAARAGRHVRLVGDVEYLALIRH